MEAKQVRSREDCRVAGDVRFYTGTPCVRGHDAERYTKTGKCVACHRAALDRYAKRDPERYAAITAKARRDYRARHPGREGHRYRERRASDPAFDAKERRRLNAWHREWTRRNHDKKFAWNAEARARKLKATPSWLTAEHRAQIRAIYREAKTRPGGPWDVDHIIPLQGDLVCGLHVPWNLRVIPQSENRAKGNKLIAY